jgi:hypothetical protein
LCRQPFAGATDQSNLRVPCGQTLVAARLVS